MTAFDHILRNMDKRVPEAVRFYWEARQQQAQRQVQAGRSDQGARAAVTGGYQMGGFGSLIKDLFIGAGIESDHIYDDIALEIPGFFRPTKEWDILVVRDGQLIAALELKSQVGPSFGNNFNNRTEEAMGSALDLWTAFREGAFNKTHRPWLGYLFLLEDCEKSRSPVRVAEPHFKVFHEFRGASYAKRYELFCRKLVREGHYNAAAFLVSPKGAGINGAYSEPAQDLAFAAFARSLVAHAAAFGQGGK
jgi:hypothetical protein